MYTAVGRDVGEKVMITRIAVDSNGCRFEKGKKWVVTRGVEEAIS